MKNQKIKTGFTGSDKPPREPRVYTIPGDSKFGMHLRRRAEGRMKVLEKRLSSLSAASDGESVNVAVSSDDLKWKYNQLSKWYANAGLIEKAVCADRRLALGQAKKITGLTRRKIIYWQSVDKLSFGQEKAYDPRRFSVGDVIKLMIIKELKEKFGIPPKRLNRFIAWIQKYNIVDARLPDFSVGRDIFLYSDLKAVWYSGHGADGSIPREWGNSPVIIMPLNDIFKKVLLSPAVFSDNFKVKKLDGQFVYFIDGRPLDFSVYNKHPNPGGGFLELQKSDLPLRIKSGSSEYILKSGKGNNIFLDLHNKQTE